MIFYILYNFRVSYSSIFCQIGLRMTMMKHAAAANVASCLLITSCLTVYKYQLLIRTAQGDARYKG